MVLEIRDYKDSANIFRFPNHKKCPIFKQKSFKIWPNLEIQAFETTVEPTLTALSIFYSLNTFSKSSAQYKPSHGTFNQMNEHIVTGCKKMKLTNGKFPESCHSTLRQSEERHGFKTKRKLGSPMHQQRSWQSLTLYNSKRAGHVTPLRLKKKSKTSSPSSTCTPFSKHFLERFPEALEKHNLLNKK